MINRDPCGRWHSTAHNLTDSLEHTHKLTDREYYAISHYIYLLALSSEDKQSPYYKKLRNRTQEYRRLAMGARFSGV